MKNFENRLKTIQEEVEKRVPQLAFLDFRNGKYYKPNTNIEVDIDTIQSGILIIDDIPIDEEIDNLPAPLQFAKGSDIANESDG